LQLHWQILIALLLTAGGMALLSGNAEANVSLPAREDVQAISWTIELVTFLAAMAIAWFIWRMSKRDSQNKKSKRDMHDSE
jgi:membrane protein implicated in regulation of membrane protease activity